MSVTREECQTNVKTMSQKIDEVKTKVQSIELILAKMPKTIADELSGKYVSKEAFAPIQKIVYGLVGGILIAFLAGIIAFVFK